MPWHTYTFHLIFSTKRRAAAAAGSIFRPADLPISQPGISAEDLAALEAHLQLPIPVSVRAIYRLHNGQDESKVCAEDAISPTRAKSGVRSGAYTNHLGLYGHTTRGAASARVTPRKKAF